jgi:ABC-type enterochelin transport system permease subunit
MKNKQSEGYGVAALVTGIVGLLLSFVPFIGLILGIIATVCAGKQLKQGKSGMAVAGLVLGIITMGISLFVLFFWMSIVYFIV